MGVLNYQSDGVPRSVRATGNVGITRLASGKDSEPFGLDARSVQQPIYNGRGAGLTLDRDGCAIVGHSWAHPDYLDEVQILVRPCCLSLTLHCLSLFITALSLLLGPGLPGVLPSR